MGLLQEGSRLSRLRRSTLIAPVILAGTLLAGCDRSNNSEKTGAAISLYPVNCATDGPRVNTLEIPLYPNQIVIVANHAISAQDGELTIDNRTNSKYQSGDITVTSSGIDFTDKTNTVAFHVTGKPVANSNVDTVTVTARCNNN